MRANVQRLREESADELAEQFRLRFSMIDPCSVSRLSLTTHEDVSHSRLEYLRECFMATVERLGRRLLGYWGWIDIRPRKGERSMHLYGVILTRTAEDAQKFVDDWVSLTRADRRRNKKYEVRASTDQEFRKNLWHAVIYATKPLPDGYERGLDHLMTGGVLANVWAEFVNTGAHAHLLGFEAACESCRKPMAAFVRGQRRKYCGNACRQAAHRANNGRPPKARRRGPGKATQLCGPDRVLYAQLVHDFSPRSDWFPGASGFVNDVSQILGPDTTFTLTATPRTQATLSAEPTSASPAKLRKAVRNGQLWETDSTFVATFGKPPPPGGLPS